MLKRLFSHINEAWAYVLMDRLHRVHGVQDLCIAPGSRSAPLVLAAARYRRDHPDVTLHSHFDERGLAFFALGLAKSSRRPVAIVTTSGTAVANLHPAMTEAFEDHRPLIAISADRPEELHGCGANQTINQLGIFATHLRGELRLPSPDPSWSAGRLGRELDGVLRRLHGVDAGPVHVNAPFHEPLYGATGQQDFSAWLADLEDGRHESTEGLEPDDLPRLTGPLLLVAGRLEAEEAAAVLALGQRFGIPIVTDIGSQLRLLRDPAVLEGPDLLFASPRGRAVLEGVEQVLQFGGRLTGKRVNQWLSAFEGPRWLVSRHSAYLDPEHRAVAIQADIPAFCRKLVVLPQTDLGLTPIARELSARVDGFLAERFSELAAARIVSEEIPPTMALLPGNSLSIRLMDMFARPRLGNACVTNRGASGIDGLLATACGFAQRDGVGVTLLLGDLSLLHDLNSLALAARSPGPLVIVVLNNDGGGIFNLLPAKEQGEWFETLFQLPHGLNFQQAAAQFGVRYACPVSAPALRAEYAEACARQGCTLIELRFAPGQSAELLQELTRRLRDDQTC
ncbi:2-succinyl-5-enolpyruvyl-6-hydroxy-3-cyclohexene-1-carboxylic-acid synthase [Thioalkalivibrio sp.]|uniref:2-succinyl-5-enolpyruvyl-6-hydroxy-3- cyclohexene-1-carboxylic-acid synthase n=1 Tax=Thioalkalivibrio sp. TaxID=2093813 RepID=UPI0012D6CA47|nr:2-succinyl-5-enolpyruvyl-6-hydroxy-3-cyclohexene-1-carboxylic-acid synthase [Thioalkalivibrio sp.]TVP78914.1 MAG: 2-succinyl-5-enolpyruvyl-6-hydroxy-3-cyclohexene-1-carboxylic-acid synthase [Thioalkalivibrio sp.]